MMPKRRRRGGEPPAAAAAAERDYDDGDHSIERFEEALLRGSVVPPPATAAAAGGGRLGNDNRHNGRKSGNDRRGGGGGEGRKRPPPPPPPPASLISLLRNDESVLEYFNALNANLEHDVEMWKKRAEGHRKECRELRRRLSGGIADGGGDGRRKRRKKANDDADADGTATTTTRKKAAARPGATATTEKKKKKKPRGGKEEAVAAAESDEQQRPGVVVEGMERLVDDAVAAAVPNGAKAKKGEEKGKGAIDGDGRIGGEREEEEELPRTTDNVGIDDAAFDEEMSSASSSVAAAAGSSTSSASSSSAGSSLDSAFDDEDRDELDGGGRKKKDKKTKREEKGEKSGRASRTELAERSSAAAPGRGNGRDAERDTLDRDNQRYQQQQQQQRRQREFVLGRLREAYACLNLLGVSLVERREVVSQRTEDGVAEAKEDGEGEGELGEEGVTKGEGEDGSAAVSSEGEGRKDGAAAAGNGKENDGKRRGDGDGDEEDDGVPESFIFSSPRRSGGVAVAGTANGAPHPNIGYDKMIEDDGDGPSENVAEQRQEENEQQQHPQPQPQQKQETRRVILIRRSDEEVAADLMRSLRTLVRASSLVPDRTLARRYGSFLLRPSSSSSPDDGGGSCFPCCYYPPPDGDDRGGVVKHHPSADGLRLAVRALAVMDSYCGPSALPCGDAGTWDSLFVDIDDKGEEGGDSGAGGNNDDDVLEVVRRGMQDRWNLAASVLESIDGEVSRRWAAEDRSARRAAEVLHFDPLTEANDENEDEDERTEGGEGAAHQCEGGDDSDPKKELESGGRGELGLPRFRSSLNAGGAPFDPKSYNRLALLAERVVHASLASAMCHCRDDSQEAARLVVDYVLSSTPSLGVEDHPKLPPVLSLCVLEALLCGYSVGGGNVDELLQHGHYSTTGTDADDAAASLALSTGKSTSWFGDFLLAISRERSSSREILAVPLLGRALSLCIHSAVSVWKERNSSKDCRIRDISRVELAAFERLLAKESAWLVDEISPNDTNLSESDLAEATASLALNESKQCTTLSALASPAVALQLFLTLVGKMELAFDICKQTLVDIEASSSDNGDAFSSERNLVILLICVKAYTAIKSYKLESVEMPGGTNRAILPDVVGRDLLSPVVDKLLQVLERGGASCHSLSFRWYLAFTIAQCCAVLADGNGSYRVAQWVVSQGSITTPNHSLKQTLAKSLGSILDLGSFPTVRVINLQRRSDRWLNFVDQAQRAQVMVVKAVSTLDAAEDKDGDALVSTTDGHDSLFWGNHAFDGQGSNLEFENRMSEKLSSCEKPTLISDFVDMHWRPSDLMAFDKDARDDGASVVASPSERACALSHIASWTGVLRSLHDRSGDEGDGNLILHSQKVLRLFKVSGFASGPALLRENDSMPPAPVCVILEDDAVLVDRFSDRLASILQELPRDFHYCSLGYSRPKNAPMVEYSRHVGIPSFLWYLTGYVLSLEGAKRLLKDLPVVGPVDSWIGLKICSNWDNEFGHSIGVGRDARKAAAAATSLPPRRDLAKILKFRAFAALIPLCSQKVGASSTAASFYRSSWRDRDTDVTYSGLL